MRMFQFMGLTPEAEDFLDKRCVKVDGDFCSRCGRGVPEKLLVLDAEHQDSFYGDGPDLHTYQQKQGGLVKERIQAEPWSSGPVCFLCLELYDGTRIGEWSNEEIERG